MASSSSSSRGVETRMETVIETESQKLWDEVIEKRLRKTVDDHVKKEKLKALRQFERGLKELDFWQYDEGLKEERLKLVLELERGLSYAQGNYEEMDVVCLGVVKKNTEKWGLKITFNPKTGHRTITDY